MTPVPAISSAIENSSVLEEQKKTMKRALDPALGDSISFSGADIRAVVYLPLSQEELEKQRNNLYNELTTLQGQLRDATSEWQELSTSLTEANVALAEAILEQSQYSEGTPEYIYWTAEIRVRRTTSGYYGNLLRNLNLRYSPPALETLKSQIAATEQRFNQLDSTYNNMTGGEVTRPVVLGNLQTITYSTHREKFPVRVLGRILPKSYTRGPRTIAGSMIFTVINKHCLWELLQAHMKFYNTGVKGSNNSYPELTAASVDQLPPFDITLLFSNEVGDNSYMVLYGVEIVNEGQTMSIQDLMTENVMQFVARDIDLLQPIHENRRILSPGAPLPKTVEDLLMESKTGSVARRKQRMNPFI